MKKIYVDVCTLCRPYDDQTYARIHMETSAGQLILAAVERKLFQLVWSPVHLKEIEATTDLIERAELLNLIEKTPTSQNIDVQTIRSRAEHIVIHGLGVADAAHLAYAESLQADLISCDDKFVKRSNIIKPAVWIGNPVAFCEKEELL